MGVTKETGRGASTHIQQAVLEAPRRGAEWGLLKEIPDPTHSSGLENDLKASSQVRTDVISKKNQTTNPQ